MTAVSGVPCQLAGRVATEIQSGQQWDRGGCSWSCSTPLPPYAEGGGVWQICEKPPCSVCKKQCCKVISWGGA